MDISRPPDSRVPAPVPHGYDWFVHVWFEGRRIWHRFDMPPISVILNLKTAIGTLALFMGFGDIAEQRM